MSELVDPTEIETIVGHDRHPTRHLARAVSEEGKVYILHPYTCLSSGIDLRDCAYSLALDNGINLDYWVEDEPVHVIFRKDDSNTLVPCELCELPYEVTTPW